MQIGISTFGEVTPDNLSGKALNAHKAVQDILEQIKLADEVGLDVFAAGEHHRKDFVISAPEMILAAGAAITKNIRLSSAVTVLSSTDPVRTFQNFATLDLISGGRAEIMAGRGSFIESFPLFGQDLNDYNELFTEKLGLLMAINDDEIINWQGKFRTSLKDQGVYPRPIQEKLPIWIAVGGTPESVARAGRLNLPLTMAILGGPPDRFAPLANLYRKSAKDAGHDVDALQLGINVHFYAADNSKQAGDEFFGPYAQLMNRVGKERGWSPLDRSQYEQSRAFGPLLVGSPEQIIDKMVGMYEIFGNTRFLLQMVAGDSISQEQILHSIELLGKVIAPEVRRRVAELKAK